MPKSLQVVFCAVVLDTLQFIYGVPAKAAEPFDSRICIERGGEMGSVNVTPVTIQISDAGTHSNLADLKILGEQEVCVGFTYAQDANELVRLSFPRPYTGPWEKLHYWQTEPIPVSIKSGTTTHLVLCENPKQDRNRWWDAGWHEMWLLLPRSKQNLCAKFQ